MQKQADLTDHIESAVRGGVNAGRAGLRTARELWHKSLLPALHTGEKIITDEVVNPAANKLSGLYNNYGLPVYNKVVKGITGLSDTVRAARRAYPGIRQDIGTAADRLLADLKRLYRSSRENSGRTIDNLRRDLVTHSAGSSVNFNEFRNRAGSTINNAYNSISSRLSPGMDKSSALQGLGFYKEAGLLTPIINWGKGIAGKESKLLAEEAAARASKQGAKTMETTMAHTPGQPVYGGHAGGEGTFTWTHTPAGVEAQKAMAQQPGLGAVNLNIYGAGASPMANAAAPAAAGVSNDAINATVEAAVRRAMASQGAAAGAPRTFMSKIKDNAPSALLFGGAGYGLSQLSGGGAQAPQQVAVPSHYDMLMAQQGQYSNPNPLGGPLGGM